MTYVHPKCKHPQDQRKKLTEGRVHCNACDRTYTSPKAQVRHGTTRGFSRHKRHRKGRWPWPLEAGTCGCLEAMQEYQREVRTGQGREELRKVRGAARQAALLDLRRQFPAEFLRHYTAELGIRGYNGEPGKGVRRPNWDDMVSQLVKEVLGADEAEVTQKVLQHWATPRERNVMRLVWRIRAVLGERQ